MRRLVASRADPDTTLKAGSNGPETPVTRPRPLSPHGIDDRHVRGGVGVFYVTCRCGFRIETPAKTDRVDLVLITAFRKHALTWS
jgi:hypothetical protein